MLLQCWNVSMLQYCDVTMLQCCNVAMLQYWTKMLLQSKTTFPLQSLTHYFTLSPLYLSLTKFHEGLWPYLSFLLQHFTFTFKETFPRLFHSLSLSSSVAIFHFRLLSWEEFGVNDISRLWNLCSQVKTPSLRDASGYQSGWIFGKVPNNPPHFWKIILHFFGYINFVQ